jgi:outer membrane lipoprotein-sorting protein
MKTLGAACLILWAGVFSALLAQELTTAQVLAKLDEKAKVFTSLDATLSNSQVVADDKAPPQTGKLYIKMEKGGSAPRLLWDITEPKNAETYLIDKSGLLILNRSKKTVSRKPVGNNSDMLQLLVMGFGVSSATLTKNYKAEAKPRVTVNGVQTVPLELQSITEATAKFAKITLYLDPQTWTPVRTRIIEKGALSGDYNDFNYSNIKLNKGVSDSVFNLKLPNNAKK